MFAIAPRTRQERFQPGHPLQHPLLEVHHQQRRALRVEGGRLLAHAFSLGVP
jgi:hypothetical protein